MGRTGRTALVLGVVVIGGFAGVLMTNQGWLPGRLTVWLLAGLVLVSAATLLSLSFKASSNPRSPSQAGD